MGALLAQLAAQGVAVRALPDGRLYAAGALNETTRATIRERKAAILAELAANDPAPVATPEQAAELRELVGIVAVDWPDVERAEVIACALADPVGALTCFRALVAGRHPAENTAREQRDDGMRTCVECAYLSPGGRCLAAFRGDLPGYPRSYSPALTDRPQRCAGYAPGPDDPDRRTGRERWPLLLNVAEGSR